MPTVPPQGIGGGAVEVDLFWDIIKERTGDLTRTITDASPVADPALSVTTLEAGTYQFEVRIIATSNATMNMEIAMGTSGTFISPEIWGPESTNLKGFSIVNTQVIDFTGITVGFFVWKGTFKLTSAASVSFNWTLEATDTSATVHQGSTLALKKIP